MHQDHMHFTEAEAPQALPPLLLVSPRFWGGRTVIDYAEVNVSPGKTLLKITREIKHFRITCKYEGVAHRKGKLRRQGFSRCRQWWETRNQLCPEINWAATQQLYFLELHSHNYGLIRLLTSHTWFSFPRRLESNLLMGGDWLPVPNW